MRIRTRRWLVAPLLGVALTAALVSPANAAPIDYGATEDSVSWVDTAQGKTYTLHFRAKVTEDATPNPDKWRATFRAWCTVSPGGNTPCNHDLFGMYLTNCSFNAPAGCGWPARGISGTNKNVMGGPANKECDNVYECVYTGAWHNQQATFDWNNGAIDALQVRFLASTGNHLTNVYDMCSRAVSYGAHDTIAAACDELQAV